MTPCTARDLHMKEERIILHMSSDIDMRMHQICHYNVQFGSKKPEI